MRIRFVANVIGDDKTARMNGQLVSVTKLSDRQPPEEWGMPRTYDVKAEDGTEFVAFADELIVEDDE